jgi:hypothetical protein
MNTRILIITGMHRSGTSLISHWLYRCGLFLGKNLLPGNEGNVEGHFEDIDFLQLHQSFLLSRKCSSSGFTDNLVSMLTIPEKLQIRMLIEDKSLANREWGWKDPRTCLFLEGYHDLIPSAFYLFVVRDYNSTVNSMLTRECKIRRAKFHSKKELSKIKWILLKKNNPKNVYSKYAEHYLKTWIHYYEQILKHIRLLIPENYMIVSYASLLCDDKHVFERLKNVWQFSLEYSPFTDTFKKEFVSEVKNIEPYITNRNLINRAEEIERQIKTLYHSYGQSKK